MGEPPHRLCCGWKTRDAAPSSLTVSFPHSMHRLNTTLGTGRQNRTILLRATAWFTVTAEVSRNIPQVYNRFRLHVSPPQHRVRNETTRREQSQQRGGKKKKARMPGVVLSHTFRLTALFLNNFLWEVQTPLKTLRCMRHTPCSANQHGVLARGAKQTTIHQRKCNNPELRLLIWERPQTTSAPLCATEWRQEPKEEDLFLSNEK